VACHVVDILDGNTWCVYIPIYTMDNFSSYHE